MINFNVPPCAEKAMEYMKECVGNQKICGDGPYKKSAASGLRRKRGRQSAF